MIVVLINQKYEKKVQGTRDRVQGTRCRVQG